MMTEEIHGQFQEELGCYTLIEGSFDQHFVRVHACEEACPVIVSVE